MVVEGILIWMVQIAVMVLGDDSEVQVEDLRLIVV